MHHQLTKADAIYTLGDLMDKGGNLSDKAEYLEAVFAREESGSTGLGDGIATPHAKSAGVKEAGLAAMVVPNGVDFGGPRWTTISPILYDCSPRRRS